MNLSLLTFGKDRSYSAWFFLMFYIMGIMVLMNIFIGFFIGIFLEFYTTDDKSDDQKEVVNVIPYNSNTVGSMGKLILKKEYKHEIKLKISEQPSIPIVKEKYYQILTNPKILLDH